MSDFNLQGIDFMLSALARCPQYSSQDFFTLLLQQLQKTDMTSAEASVLCRAFYSITRILNASISCESAYSALWQTLSTLVANISGKMDQLNWRDILDVGKAVATLKSNGGQIAYLSRRSREKRLFNIPEQAPFLSEFESAFYSHLGEQEVEGAVSVIILRVLVHSATAIPSDIEVKVMQALENFVPRMDSPDVGITMWGLVRLKDILAGEYKSLVHCVARRGARLASSLEFRHLAHCIWGMGMFWSWFSSSEFTELLTELEGLAISVIDSARGVQPVHISHLIEGFAKLRYRPQDQLLLILQDLAGQFAAEEWDDGRKLYGHIETMTKSLKTLGVNADHPLVGLMASIRKQLSEAALKPSIGMAQQTTGNLVSGEGDDLALASVPRSSPSLSDSTEPPASTAFACALGPHLSSSSREGLSAGTDARIARGIGRGRPIPAWQTRLVDIDGTRVRGGGTETEMRLEEKEEEDGGLKQARSCTEGKDGNQTRDTWVAGQGGGEGCGKEGRRQRGEAASDAVIFRARQRSRSPALPRPRASAELQWNTHSHHAVGQDSRERLSARRSRSPAIPRPLRTDRPNDCAREGREAEWERAARKRVREEDETRNEGLFFRDRDSRIAGVGRGRPVPACQTELSKIDAPGSTRHALQGKVREASDPRRSGLQANPSLSTDQVLTQGKEGEKGGRCARERTGTGTEGSGRGKGMSGGAKKCDSPHWEKESRACEDPDGGVEGPGKWRQVISASKGRAYWFNPVTGESRWEMKKEFPKPIQPLLPGGNLAYAPGSCKRAGGPHAGEQRASKTAKTHDSKQNTPPTALGLKPERVNGPSVTGAEDRLPQPLTTAGGLQRGASAKGKSDSAVESVAQFPPEQTKQGGIRKKLPRIPVRAPRRKE